MYKAFMILISSVYLAILGYCHRTNAVEINYLNLLHSIGMFEEDLIRKVLKYF